MFEITPDPVSKSPALQATGLAGLLTERAGSSAVREPRPWESSDPGDEIVCECLLVRLHTIQACVDRGCRTQEDLARETGVTTVCGGCTQRVSQMVGGPGGYATRIIEVIELLPTVRSFRLQADPARFGGDLFPGQHIILSVMIDGEWVSRPYTLTSPPGHRIQEITVKLEEGGTLSRWFFERDDFDDAEIRISPPQGNFRIDLTEREPIVFFAGGIGITPAVSLARTFAAKGGHLVHIDYSARQAESFAFSEELRELSTWCAQITTSFRVSGRGERLDSSAVAELFWRFPRGRFYICGPLAYLEAVKRHLRRAGVEEDRIHVEIFTPSRGPSPSSSGDAGAGATMAAPKQFPNKGSQALGLSLLLLYVAQGVLGWSWPWLEGLQAEEGYRRWSGALLLTYIVLQWTLPVLRARVGVDFRAVKFAYRWHRWGGAISPILFYAHATWLGYGYLLALSVVYLSNLGIGLGDKTIIQDVGRRERYVRIWLYPHVALACLTVALTLFHLFVVFAYQ